VGLPLYIFIAYLLRLVRIVFFTGIEDATVQAVQGAELLCMSTSIREIVLILNRRVEGANGPTGPVTRLGVRVRPLEWPKKKKRASLGQGWTVMRGRVLWARCYSSGSVSKVGTVKRDLGPTHADALRRPLGPGAAATPQRFRFNSFTALCLSLHVLSTSNMLCARTWQDLATWTCRFNVERKYSCFARSIDDGARTCAVRNGGFLEDPVEIHRRRKAR
jgi:hypothetical protein